MNQLKTPRILKYKKYRKKILLPLKIEKTSVTYFKENFSFCLVALEKTLFTMYHMRVILRFLSKRLKTGIKNRFLYNLFLKGIGANKRDKRRKQKQRVTLGMQLIKQVTQKPNGFRMGKGKGYPTLWIARIAPGQVLCRIKRGVKWTGLITKFLEELQLRMPIRTKIFLLHK
jgi:ribosomal protein L16/L10AE